MPGANNRKCIGKGHTQLIFSMTAMKMNATKFTKNKFRQQILDPMLAE